MTAGLNKNMEIHFILKHTYFQLFAILHTSLVLMFIYYYRGNLLVTKHTVEFNITFTDNDIKYSPH
jgi:hypothetical protein